MRMDRDFGFAFETLVEEIDFQFHLLVRNGESLARRGWAGEELNNARHRAKYSVVHCAASAFLTIYRHVRALGATMKLSEGRQRR